MMNMSVEIVTIWLRSVDNGSGEAAYHEIIQIQAFRPFAGALELVKVSLTHL